MSNDCFLNLQAGIYERTSSWKYSLWAAYVEEELRASGFEFDTTLKEETTTGLTSGDEMWSGCKDSMFSCVFAGRSGGQWL